MCAPGCGDGHRAGVEGGEGGCGHGRILTGGSARGAAGTTAGSIMTIEGLFRVVSDNEDLGLTLVRAYVSYGYGWVEEHMGQQAAGGAA